MTEAARLADVQHVELVYEPQCAVGQYAWLVHRGAQSVLKAGEAVIVADVGGGTGDFVSYTAKTDSNDGPGIKLELAGKPEGALCGSEFVNRAFLTWLQGHTDFDKRQRASGLSRSVFLKEASEAFEEKKLKFQTSTTRNIRVTIEGKGKDDWTLQITPNEMESFFAPVCERITQCLDSQRRQVPHIKVLIIPGGFGKSPYLRQELEARYGQELTIYGQNNLDKDLELPVSQGALLRYRQIQTRDFPLNSSFGITQTEPFDPVRHQDILGKIEAVRLARPRSREQAPRDATRPSFDILDMDVDGTPLVHERWDPILEQGHIFPPNQPQQTTLWTRLVVEPGTGPQEIQVYWTETNIAKSDSIRQGLDARSRLIDGMYRWGHPLVINMPDLENEGFYPTEYQNAVVGTGDDGDEDAMVEDNKVFEVHVRLVMTFDGANIQIECQIAKEEYGEELFDENGNRTDVEETMIEKGSVSRNILNARYNPRPRE